MADDHIREKVSSFLARQFRGAEVAGDVDIFASGLVNSLFAMQIVLFVEKEFDITVETEDLELDYFRSANAITGFVARKQAAGTAA